MTDRNLDHLYPDFRRRFINLQIEMENLFHPIFLTEGFRTAERQRELYSIGRIKGIIVKPWQVVTRAKPGQSYHNYGLAADIAFSSKEPYSEEHPWKLLGQIAPKHGLEWGGNWKHPDRPHLQQSYDLKITLLEDILDQGDLDTVWRVIDVVRSLS